MRKIYISGPITGIADYMERFEEAEKKLKEEYPNMVIVNPAKISSGMPKETTWEEYMKLSVFLLKECDIIYMLDGWEKSRGANREYGYALAGEIIIIGGANVEEV